MGLLVRHGSKRLTALVLAAFLLYGILPYYHSLCASYLGQSSGVEEAADDDGDGCLEDHHHNDSDADHHGKTDTCPLCQVMALGHTAPLVPYIAIPLPHFIGYAVFSVLSLPGVFVTPLYAFFARGPPASL